MHDETETARRAMLPAMPAELLARVEAGEHVWDTDRMRAEFDVIGFLAPFVVVTRRSDNVKGTLLFTHNPRYYFGWSPDNA